MHLKSATSRRTPSALWRSLLLLVALMAMMPGGFQPAAAQGTASITVTSTGEDGVTPLPFVRFRVTDSAGVVYGPLESQSPDGTVTFVVPGDGATTYTIDMETPPACGIEPEPQVAGPLADGESAAVSFATAFDPNCDLGSISAYTYSCPNGLDGASTDYATFRDSCLDAQDDVDITFREVLDPQDPQQPQEWAATTGKYGIHGRAPLVGLSPGTYRIERASLDDGQGLVVFCLAYSGNQISNPTPDSTERQELKDGGVELALDGGRIACDLFAVPGYTPPADNADTGTGGQTDTGNTGSTDDGSGNGDTGDTGTTDDGSSDQSGNGDVSEGDTATDNPVANDAINEAALVNPGEITIHLATCPPGYPGGAYYTDCHDNGIEDVTVTIDYPTAWQDSAVTAQEGGTGPGIARFGTWESGTYRIAEDIPGDTNTYWVFCSIGDPDYPVPFTYDDSAGEAIELYVNAGDTVVCDWFIVPDEQFTPGSITIFKRTCDIGYDTTGSTLADFRNDCPSKSDNIPFVLTPNSGAAARTGNTGEDGTGKLVFGGLAPGSYSLYEDVPGDFNDSYVYCSVDGGPYHPVDYSSYSAVFTIGGNGTKVRCQWFNVPYDARGPSGSIEIHKSVCPAGQQADLFNTCHEDRLQGVTFDLVGPKGVTGSAVTGSDGIVSFTDLPGGKFTITETPPAGFHTAVYVVHCTMNGEAFPITYDDATGLRIRVNLPNYANVICDWYNIPPAKGATGSVTVHKLLCEGREDNNYNWDDDCVNYGQGVGFTLTPAGGASSITGTTNGDGILVFSQLANGPWILNETSGDWCHAESDHVDAAGNVLVKDGGNTDVYIYNCGRQDVSDLPSTGLRSAPTGSSMLVGGLASLTGLVAISIFRRRQVA